MPMGRLSRRNLIAAGLTTGATLAANSAWGQTSPSPAPSIDAFFDTFTADWIRLSPNLATSARYFQGVEQDRLERRLTPETLAFAHDRIQLARQGLEQLAKFDRATAQRDSAHLGGSDGVATE